MNHRLLSLFALALPLLVSCSGGSDGHPGVTAEGGMVRVDLSPLYQGEGGRFFSWRSSTGKEVTFFVYRDGDGAAHAALDACRTCYRWRQGYRLEGETVVCRKCGLVFPIDELHRGAGSCRPISLFSALEGGQIVIPAAELEKGAAYF